MDTRDPRRTVIEATYEDTVRRPTAPDRSAGVYGAVGMLVLMLMLLIATGTVPLYEWPT